MDNKPTMNLSVIGSKLAGCGGMTSSLAVGKQKPKAKIPNTGVFSVSNTADFTIFKKHYDRGDLPIRVNFDGAHRSLKWWLDPKELDYKYYLPIFLEGLREKTEPYMFLAENGTIGMIVQGKDKIKDVLPDLIFPLKRALHTKDHDIMCKTLKIVQRMVIEHPTIGEDLVPFFRQLLPVCNLFRVRNKNIGDKIDYSQQKNKCLGDLIQETLEVLERYGGEDAYINIKYMIPTYESCMF